MDITDFMTWFINLFVNFLKYIYNTLDNITFAGTSLLKFSIFCVLIYPIITMLFTLISNRSLYQNSKNDTKNRKGDKKDDEKS